MVKRRKLTEGQKVQYKGKEWVVCRGGYTDSATNSYVYHLMRGAWHKMVRGNCITMA